MRVYLVLMVMLFSTVSLFAQKAEVFQKGGLAIGGYDPVAFFLENKPVLGSSAFTLEWKNATWRFSNQQNLDSFLRAPESYAPQYGGYCAYGMADGHKAPTQPDTWTIVEGKLYFNYNQKVKQLWNKDIPGFILKANENWPKIKNLE